MELDQNVIESEAGSEVNEPEPEPEPEPEVIQV